MRWCEGAAPTDRAVVDPLPTLHPPPVSETPEHTLYGDAAPDSGLHAVGTRLRRLVT